MRKFIEDSMWEQIALMPISSELKIALRRSPRTPVFITNMIGQCSAKYFKNKFQIKNAVYEMTKVYINAILAYEQKRMATQSTLSADAARADKLKLMNEVADTGIVTEEALES